jgi:hypothetical protein
MKIWKVSRKQEAKSFLLRKILLKEELGPILSLGLKALSDQIWPVLLMVMTISGIGKEGFFS